jgi:hypothetical protein
MISNEINGFSLKYAYSIRALTMIELKAAKN